MKWFLAVLTVLLVGCDHSVRLKTAKGDRVVLTSHDKRYIAVSYWATWCESCKHEVVAMNEISQRYRNRLWVLGVNFDNQQGKQLATAIKDLNIHYPVIVSGLPVQWNLPEPEVLPTTYLLSANHKIIKTFYGERTAQELRDWLEAG